ncbi:GNAT family N-acetyltransferase [Ferdinandcohnia quinoae]|uniref:GNAT family N-acetyltransferase n=1 Tax=Fredinandcohnia quinoae TaxID=2918902 RepID=A0AAW5E3R9_9BACI|nr:GNAT family N-acetyltransferase [Fredinandcohnia sp. SECRCQ15]MCH1624205.1 GNAT family N-acetyltransferase [Fredinandcohnia sp. SECRCQ15]
MLYSKNMVQGIELASEKFNKAVGLFEALNHHLSINGVIKGAVPGRVFLSNNCETALLTSPQGIFLGGSTENIPFFEEVNKLIKDELLPGLSSNGELDYVLYYPTDKKWEDILPIVMKDILPMRSGRMTFSHNLSRIDDLNDPSIVAINGNFLKRQDVIGLNDIKSEILENWPSLEAYEDKGFGCAAILDTNEGPTIISWCLTDWVVEDECEIGIETDEDYRGNGWARKTALGTLSLAKQRGIKRVGWQCWSNNIASQRTALSVGFKLLADFPVLFGWNHPLNNLLVNGNHYMLGDRKYGVAKDFARSARSYAEALDKGWDWNGDAALYWNAACMFYLIGEKERAKHYFKKARDMGWKDIHQPHYHEYVYRESDSEQIASILSELL